jgi:hypothetical protein
MKGRPNAPSDFLISVRISADHLPPSVSNFIQTLRNEPLYAGQPTVISKGHAVGKSPGRLNTYIIASRGSLYVVLPCAGQRKGK